MTDEGIKNVNMNDVDEKVKTVAAMLFFLGVPYNKSLCLGCYSKNYTPPDPKRLYEALYEIGADPRVVEQEIRESGRPDFKFGEKHFGCVKIGEFIEVVSKLL